MIIYRWKFIAKCPANGAMIRYHATIETFSMIRVEDLLATTDAIGEGFHEAIAETLFEKFGGRQAIRAHHHGVNIETRKGSPW